MKDLIEREKVLEAFLSRGSGYYNMMALRDMINAIPTADVPLVMRGKFVMRGKWEDYKCSICDERPDNYMSGDVWIKHFPSYCPNCGARMDGGAENDA